MWTRCWTTCKRCTSVWNGCARFGSASARSRPACSAWPRSWVHDAMAPCTTPYPCWPAFLRRSLTRPTRTEHRAVREGAQGARVHIAVQHREGLPAAHGPQLQPRQPQPGPQSGRLRPDEQPRAPRTCGGVWWCVMVCGGWWADRRIGLLSSHEAPHEAGPLRGGRRVLDAVQQPLPRDVARGDARPLRLLPLHRRVLQDRQDWYPLPIHCHLLSN